MYWERYEGKGVMEKRENERDTERRIKREKRKGGGEEGRCSLFRRKVDRERISVLCTYDLSFMHTELKQAHAHT